MSGPALTPAQRRTLARLADVLVAEGLGMPSASSVGVADGLLDRCLEAAPVLVARLAALLDEVPEDGIAEDGKPEDGIAAYVRRLEADRPDDFGVLSTTVVGAYFLSAEVRTLIGYPGQQPSPLSVAAEPDYLDMLERVHDRHPGYRECP